MVLHGSGCALAAGELLEGLGLSTSALDGCAEADLGKVRLDVAVGVAVGFARHAVLRAGQCRGRGQERRAGGLRVPARARTNGEMTKL